MAARMKIVSQKLLLQVLGAIATIVAIHGLMHWLKVPSPQALILAAVLNVALIAVLFSQWLLIDKLKVYLVFVVMLVVGGNSICGCTHVELFLASAAGLITFAALDGLKRILSFIKSRSKPPNHDK